ncbi:ABC transporter permease [Mycolicibacterium grossiae]|uniref:Oligopeptide transport system permease protein OppC n=1 Tax=Mycolicibacterium grossiae TaxID=1552759 RepID=A0A1E8PX35_9MYCO|nr:peptide ABC transporter permease [Mycolicibacterium grossiae]QEM47661.1 ABC transporter permease [Mycolicibacterium grossiae]
MTRSREGAQPDASRQDEPQATDASTSAQSGVAVGSFASRRTLTLRRFLRNRLAVGALLVLLGLAVGCYALPPLLPWSYTDLDYLALQQPPSPSHWFGTNALGQDLLAQTLRGMQKSLLIGVCVALVSTVIAATVGAIAGYFVGWRDRALMWLVDLLLVVPSFILILIITPRTRGSDTVLWLILLLAVFSWMISARMVRGLTMSLKEREFITAARYMGVSNTRIIVRHVLPNVASILIIDTALNVGVAILAETGLSFLGFGIQPPDVSLGTLISDGTQSAFTFPWLFLFPAGVLVLIVVCANVIGDALRDALDPSARTLRRRRG